jgi:hypothetical protein
MVPKSTPIIDDAKFFASVFISIYKNTLLHRLIRKIQEHDIRRLYHSFYCFYNMTQWVSDCCLTPNEQIFSYIMTEISHISMRWCMYVMLIYTTSVINVMVSVLASSAFGSKPKTAKLVFAASLLSTQF